MGTALSLKQPKVGELQMDWLRSEDLNEEQVATTPTVTITHQNAICPIQIKPAGASELVKSWLYGPKKTEKAIGQNYGRRGHRSRQWLCLQDHKVPRLSKGER